MGIELGLERVVSISRYLGARCGHGTGLWPAMWVEVMALLLEVTHIWSLLAFLTYLLYGENSDNQHEGSGLLNNA